MSEYNDVQKTFLSLVVIPCTIVCFFLYKYAKKRLVGTSDNQAKRMEKWYAILAGGTLGQFFCHTLRKGLVDTGIIASGSGAIGYNFLIGFVLLAFFILYSIDKYSLVWNNNPYHNLSGSLSRGTEHILDRDNIEEARYHESIDVTSQDFAIHSFQVMDEVRLIKIRRRRAIMFYILMLILVMIEGVYLVYRQEVAMGGPPTLVAVYWIDKIMESIILSAILIHGNFHAMAEGKHKWFWVLCGIWCFAVLCSTIPALLGLTTEQVAPWVEWWFTGIVHAIAGGVLFYNSIYFIFLNRPGADRKETCASIFLSVGACTIAFITGIFV
jgi:hypothetical protein